jgi:hypothetical protein
MQHPTHRSPPGTIHLYPEQPVMDPTEITTKVMLLNPLDQFVGEPFSPIFRYNKGDVNLHGSEIQALINYRDPMTPGFDQGVVRSERGEPLVTIYGPEHIYQTPGQYTLSLFIYEGDMYRKNSHSVQANFILNVTQPPMSSNEAAEVEGYNAMEDAYTFNEDTIDSGSNTGAASYSEVPGYAGYLADLQTKAAVDSVFQGVDAADWNRFWSDMTEIQTMMTAWFQWLSSGQPGNPSTANLRDESLGLLLDSHSARNAVDFALPPNLPVTG